MKNSKQESIKIDLPGFDPSATDLRGRQSVRATFRLSEACINAISILSAQLGIKQKSVFDHLMEDPETLSEVARHLSEANFDQKERVQKSFVISRRSLLHLNTISSRHDTPRDALVEYSVKGLLPLIAAERKKHRRRKALMVEIAAHFKKTQELLAKTQKKLSRDDPLVRKLADATAVYQNVIDEITTFIEKGELIERFQIDQR